MITLILNAAEARVQFVIAEQHKADDQPDSILLAVDMDAPSRGTELLPPALHDGLARMGLTIGDVGRIACVHGPGSFTGLRLVLAFAAALRRACGAELAGLNALQAIAASLPFIPEMATRCRVMTHARRELVHAQDFLLSQNAVPAPDGFYASPAMVDLKDVLSNLQGPALLLGSGLDRNRVALHDNACHAGFTPLYNAGQPSPAGLLRLVQSAQWAHNDLEPLYLRPCDAVENLPHIARKRGDDPEAVCAKLDELLK